MVKYILLESFQRSKILARASLFSAIILISIHVFANECAAQFAQANAQEFLTVTEAENIPIRDRGTLVLTKEDFNAAKERVGWYASLKKKVFGSDYEIKPEDSESLVALKTYLKKRELSIWFRFKDQVASGLKKKPTDMKALVKPLISPQESLLARLMMIRQAKHSVDLAYYIFANDASSMAILNELRAAVSRGVNVRILVDSIGSASGTLRGNPHLKALLTHARTSAGFVIDPTTGQPTPIRAKVEIVVFNPVTNVLALARDVFIHTSNLMLKWSGVSRQDNPLAPSGWNINRRMHDKVLITDAEFPELAVAILGGRNIADRYFEVDPKDLANFRDTDVLVRNHPDNYDTKNAETSIGEVLNNHFDRLYFHRANRRIVEGAVGYVFGREHTYKKLDASTEQVAAVTQKALQALGEDFHSADFGKRYLHTGFTRAEASIATSIENLIRSTGEMLKLAGEIRKDKTPEQIKRELAESMNHQSTLKIAAELMVKETQEVTIVSPYLWISETDLALIKYWLKQDGKRRLKVYTNSAITSDNIPAQALVDLVTGPKLMLDPEISSQVQVFSYGRIDDVALGGKQVYGKLHYKGMYFKALQTTLITTYNKDPRSQIINSELGVVVRGPRFANETESDLADIEQKSHLWGSEEYRQIRNHKNLKGVAKLAIEHQKKTLWLLENLKLWWLI